MKKKYLSIFLSVLLMGGFTSCNDWLDIEQNTEKDAEEMFDNYDGFKGALSGCYSNLAKTDLYGTRMTMSNVESLASLWYLENTPQSYSTEIMTNYYLRVHDYSQTSAQDVIETIYSNLYNAVLETNMIIKAFADGKGAVIPDATTRAIIEGEAYGLRALLQLDILRLFGQIPNGATVQVSLPYSEVTAYNDELTYYPFDKYVEKLKSDIEQAKTLLKDNDPVCQYSMLSLNTSSLSGEIPLDDDFLYYRQYRLNYWAVRALEARMYMYLGDKTKAHDIALEVINATTANGDKVIELSSNTDYGQAAANLAYNSPSECLFSLYFYNLHDISYPLLFGVPTVEGETDSRGVNPQYNLVLTPGNKESLLNGSDINDIRRDLWVNSRTIQSNEYPTLCKYYVGEDSPGIVPMLRLSEMYLIAIEGATSLDEANSLYTTYMESKEVSRTNYFDSMNKVMEQLPNEYRLEFFGEGQIFYFYKRNNTRLLWSNESQPMDEGLYIVPNPDTDF